MRGVSGMAGRPTKRQEELLRLLCDPSERGNSVRTIAHEMGVCYKTGRQTPAATFWELYT